MFFVRPSTVTTTVKFLFYKDILKVLFFLSNLWLSFGLQQLLPFYRLDLRKRIILIKQALNMSK